ncbi:MAG: NifU family protein [Chloroflexi bacterium]|nr:NifU family protein [Chloroflexota bacterium]
MVASTSDPQVNMVLENIETMVASEGGTLELVALGDTSLHVKYLPGVNEECPECVPTRESVEMFMTMSLKIHAPNVTEITVDEGPPNV